MKISSKKNDIKNIVENSSELREKLFARGFIFTDKEIDQEEYPFYGNWKRSKTEGYYLLVSPQQKYYIKSHDAGTMILIGHAYNPFRMQDQENVIIDSLLQNNFASDAFWNELNEWTGIFTLIYIEKDNVYIIGDPTCMQTTFYGYVKGNIYISSHTNLLGDLLNLEWDPYVQELSKYRFFPLLGNALPGDLTQYKEIKRLVPNFCLKLKKTGEKTVFRFYYPESLTVNTNEIAKNAGEILHKNMILITKKWDKPAISMTGGCDSKTTLSCAKGLYDKFSYFSYISSESEKVDAEAAHQICEILKLKHQIYSIPVNDDAFRNIEKIRTILEWNTGNIIPNNKNDVRKRAFFADRQDFDVEVKSWASEIGRAYYSKRFNGRKNFGTSPTPRKCTTLYKFFLNNRRLVKKTDFVFKEYLKRYFQMSPCHPIEWQDQFFWEYRVPSWNGLVITGEHRYSFDITIPYNNRRLLELLVSAPLSDRINDTVYQIIRKKMNPAIDETGIAVTNIKHTKMRERAENLYYILHSRIIF